MYSLTDACTVHCIPSQKADHQVPQLHRGHQAWDNLTRPVQGSKKFEFLLALRTSSSQIILLALEKSFNDLVADDLLDP